MSEHLRLLGVTYSHLTDLVDLHEDESICVVVHEAGDPALPGLTNDRQVFRAMTNERRILYLIHVGHKPRLGGQRVVELCEAA